MASTLEINSTSRFPSAENFELRTEKRPSALISLVQDAVAGVDKSISLDFHSLAEQVDDSLVQERLLATLSGFFGGLALLLAMIGLYGALSYLVVQRRAEFGIRMALGAPQRSILALVMRDVAAVLAGGVAAGVGTSLAAVGLLRCGSIQWWRCATSNPSLNGHPVGACGTS